MARVFEEGYLRDLPQPTGRVFEEGQLRDAPVAPPAMTMGQKISKAAEYLPTAGAIVGGGLSMAAAPGTAGASLLGGSALAGLGAAAGKAGEQIVKRMVGEKAPATSGEAAGEIVKEGAFTAAINAAGGKLMQMLAPSAKVAAKQILKGFARIDERASMKVLNDPNILTRAKDMPVAKENFSNFFKSIGFEYGPRSVKAATGKLALSDNAADDLIIDTIGRIEGIKGIAGKKTKQEVVQQALAARYSVSDALKRASRSGNDSKVRLFIEGRNQIDDWLETQIPGFAAVRKEYEEAKIKQAFSHLFPLNKNKETSVLGIMTTLGSTLTAGGTLGPIAAIPAAAVSSPKIAGMAIKAAEKLGTAPVGAGASELVGKSVADFIPTPEAQQIKADYKAGKIDRATAAQMLRENHGFQ